MYKIKCLCVDTIPGEKIKKEDVYWDWSLNVFETRDKALVAAFSNALEEVADRMLDSDCSNWYEASDCLNEHFEIADFVDVIYFDVDVTWYSRAPWDRENDCDIQLVTGYKVVDIDKETKLWNDKLQKKYGEGITVVIRYRIDDDGEAKWYFNLGNGKSDDWDSPEEAFYHADNFMNSL